MIEAGNDARNVGSGRTITSAGGEQRIVAGRVNRNLILVVDRDGLGHALVHDPFLLHWLHRWWAWVAVAALVVLARQLRRAGDRRASILIHSAFGTQILLGIATVLSGVEVWLAVAHQLLGALLLAATAWGAHRLGQR